jgi:hypothetical protein
MSRVLELRMSVSGLLVVMVSIIAWLVFQC